MSSPHTETDWSGYGPVPMDVTPPPRRSPKGWIALVVVLLVALAFTGGYTVRTATTKPPPPTPTPKPDEPGADVAKILLPSTVFIRAGDSLGSGFVYNSAKGYVMTASHVVGTNKNVTIRLADGTPVKGKVLGRDPQRDTAVIQVAQKGLVQAKVAHESQLTVGELTVAVGSPFGLQDTVTVGVLSGLGRTLETVGGAVDALQTDAAINPGNSGGPLANREGEVIGINVAMQGSRIGLAVPIDVALLAASYLEQGKAPPRVAFLGVTGGSPASDAAPGALVVDVRANSPAAAAGLEKGDRVIAIDGKPITDFPSLASAIRKHVPGDTVTVRYVRNNKTKDVKIKLGDFS